MQNYVLEKIYQNLLTISVKGEDIFTLGNCITSLGEYIKYQQELINSMVNSDEEEE